MEAIRDRFLEVVGRDCEWTLRIVRDEDDFLLVRRGVGEPARHSIDVGVMICVGHDGGTGYAATADISRDGLRRAFERAADHAAWAAAAGARDALPQPARGSYRSTALQPWDDVAQVELLERLAALARAMSGDPRIVDWEASLWRTRSDSLLIGSHGGEISQVCDYLVPMASCTASDGRDSQTRSFGGHAHARQGGLEVLDSCGFWQCGERLREQALELLAAPQCATGVMPVVLAADQMILQIHESIGHPIELDRVLGDERNYAGGSFVTAEMFGTYRYGSPLLNVTFDPTVGGEFATYAFDDDGQAAERAEVIRNGILLRPLGGARSQRRSGLAGVANARASGWNRPAIDRMANLNLEAGEASLSQLVGAVEDGVYMETNRSWSIDDRRNKFQFGCEYGRRIRGGRLGEVVKNPSYRGVSATFWRSLDAVGNVDTLHLLGSPYCGKGEPNQIIRVGHASPACRFRGVEVFGGD